MTMVEGASAQDNINAMGATTGRGQIWRRKPSMGVDCAEQPLQRRKRRRWNDYLGNGGEDNGMITGWCRQGFTSTWASATNVLCGDDHGERTVTLLTQRNSNAPMSLA